MRDPLSVSPFQPRDSYPLSAGVLMFFPRRKRIRRFHNESELFSKTRLEQLELRWMLSGQAISIPEVLAEEVFVDPPQVSIDNAPTVFEGADTIFTVTLSHAAPTGGVEVVYSTMSDTAEGGLDYVEQVQQTLLIPEGETSGIITIQTLGDTLFSESQERFSVELESATNAVLGASASAIGLIENVGNGNGLTVTVGDAPAVSEGSSAVFPVTLSGPAPVNGVTVTYSTASGTAMSGQDFVSQNNQTLMIPAGHTSGAIEITTLSDTEFGESTETFVLLLSGSTVANLTTSSAIATIENVAEFPDAIVNIGDALSVQEGNLLLFPVTLSVPAPSGGVTVVYSTTNGTAVGGSDFVAQANQTITIPEGGTSGVIMVQTLTDSQNTEGNENLTVSLTGVANGLLGTRTSAQGVILDGFPSQNVFINIGDAATVVEGGLLAFPVTLSSQAGTGGLQVVYSTVNGTAIGGSDFTIVTSEILNIPAGSSSGTIFIQTLSDNLNAEGDEFLTVALTSVSGGIFGTSTEARGVIQNHRPIDDVVVEIGNAASVNEGETLFFPVTLSSPALAGGTMITYSTINGTATGGEDFVFLRNQVTTIPEGFTKGVIAVQALEDADNLEGDENLRVTLTGVTGGVLGISTTATGVIQDGVSTSDVSVEIGDAVSVFEGGNLIFPVSLSTPAPAGGVTVVYLIQNGTATAGEDFVHAGTQILTIDEGHIGAFISLETLSDDELNEPNEDLTVVLEGVSGGVLGVRSAATGVIQNVGPVEEITVQIGHARSVDEGTNLIFPIGLSKPAPAGGVTIEYSTINGTAQSGSDFVGQTAQTITIPEGFQTGQIIVETLNDSDINEGDENLSVALTSITGGALGLMTSGTGVIRDVQAPPNGTDSGNVEVSISGRQLSIRGDHLGNSFEILTDLNGDVIIRGIGETTINGQSEVSANVRSIRGLQISIDTGDGDDLIRIQDVQVDGTVTINTGNGHDTLLGDSLIVSRGLTINTGSGDDLVGLDNLRVDRTWSLATGSGEDRVGLNQVSVGGRTGMSLGAGNDLLLVANSSVNRKARIDLGDGDDLLGGVNVSVDRRARISGGNGFDTVDVNGFSIGSTRRVTSFESNFFDNDDVDAATMFLNELSALGFDLNL